MTFPRKFLATLGTIHTGSTPSTSNARYWSGEIPFVTPSELDQHLPVFKTPRTLTIEGGHQSRLIREGSVMVCCIGSLGKIGIAGQTLATNQQINSIEFDPQQVWPKFGYYACKTLKSKLVTMAPATTIAIVSKSKFSQLEIPVPPLSVQRRIAAILDQADTLRAKRRESLEQLESLTQSIFFEMFGDPVVNNRRWPVRSLKKLGKVLTGRTPSSSMDGMFGGSIPFVTPGDLGSNSPVNRTLTPMGVAEVVTARAGATLVCCIGTIGKMDKITTRSAFNQQINAIEWFEEIDDDFGYLALGFLKSQMVARAASTTLPILNKTAFEKFELTVPPLKLQQTFSKRLSSVNALKIIQQSAFLELDALFASLQHRAFRGEL